MTPDQICATYSGKSATCPEGKKYGVTNQAIGYQADFTFGVISIPLILFSNSGFTRLGDRCERRETGTPTQFCAPGYTLTDAGDCTAPVEPTPVFQCPPGNGVDIKSLLSQGLLTIWILGSIPRGDLCSIPEEREPEITCPPGYTLVRNEGLVHWGILYAYRKQKNAASKNCTIALLSAQARLLSTYNAGEIYIFEST